MAAFETSTTLGPCPTDEELAAFLDGTLTKAERERITAHLVECESCYEIFAGAVHFQQDAPATEQERTVVPFPSNKDGGRPIRRRWWIPAAAAAVLAVGFGLAAYRTLAEPNMETAELIESLQSKPAAADQPGPFSTYRGLGHGGSTSWDSDPPSFKVGVLFVDLRIGWTKGRDQKAADLLGQISQELDHMVAMSDRSKSYAADAEQIRHHGVDALGSPAAGLKTREAELDKDLARRSFDFGKWAEAGRLFALTQTPDFFKSRDNRRFLSIILRKKEEDKKARDTSKPREEDDFTAAGEHEDEVVDHLRAIAALWDGGDLRAGSYKKLADHFAEIIRQYDR
jgi:hypothetical protein